jgi:hypothetical protein
MKISVDKRKKNKNTRKLHINFGFMLVMTSPQGIRASVILNLSFNMHVDKRKKQKLPQITQQFWVYACYELHLDRAKKESVERWTLKNRFWIVAYS